MQINADALSFVLSISTSTEVRENEYVPRSLQVFENESHASVHSDKTKEGLSLFGQSVSFHIIDFYI